MLYVVFNFLFILVSVSDVSIDQRWSLVLPSWFPPFPPGQKYDQKRCRILARAWFWQFQFRIDILTDWLACSRTKRSVTSTRVHHTDSNTLLQRSSQRTSKLISQLSTISHHVNYTYFHVGYSSPYLQGSRLLILVLHSPSCSSSGRYQQGYGHSK